ncbi:hypothetical protein ABEB36_001024 [Hypothenemus hampei]|uniref:Calcineurin-binding protein cabin-1 n=1 Tax=Hypothenemus hampei TaxID=57062 RepID=A0ABD1FD80_HYPHA
MLKIKALNQEFSSDEDVPTIRREAQEEIALELYNKALRALAQKNYDESATILSRLVEENIPQLENNGGLPKSMSTLKYSCLVNLGNIHLKQDNINNALECFTRASELDMTDVTLWSKIGKLSLKENKFNKAVYAFSKGLECSESHWPSLDSLISVLYAIGDTISCLVYIGKALNLDSAYTKGIVIRKQIYKDNPATKEYYQLFNPEHIYEPQVIEDVNESEEEEILNEIKLLKDQVIQVEQSLRPKPLDTIPLPKTLEEYTWLSLTMTIIYCHHYITDNKMSHFTLFDMSKCMSQSGDTNEKLVSPNPILEDADLIKDCKMREEVENVPEVEKMDIDTTINERRLSQNSENTANCNENLDNTPNQTDNDENGDEQTIEVDNDNETDCDNQDTAKETKRAKRKRDVLSELQIWGWHSKRKPPKKPLKDFTVEDALNRIIPKTLLKTKIDNQFLTQNVEESMNTMDVYNMYMEDKELNFLSPIHSPESVNFETYFGTDREKEDVLSFWMKDRERVDAIVLVKEIVSSLAKLWQYKWPKQLAPLYIEVFKMYREHCDQPQPFCTEKIFEELKEDALATLLFGELYTFSQESSENLHTSIMSYLQILSSWSEEWGDEYSVFFLRYYWLQGHNFRKNDDHELAIRSFEAILEEMNSGNTTAERFSLNLPNCFKYGFVSREIVEKIIKHLNMISSLGNVEIFFNNQRYREVAETLKQTFHCGSYPKVGRMGRPAQLGILMHSLWFTDWDECFVWTEECLHEAVLNHGKSNADRDKWEKIIEKCLGIFREIIKKETVSIIDKLQEDKRCRLVETLCKIVCKQLNSEGVSGVPLGSAWMLLHYVLLREEHRQYVNKRLTQSKRDKIDEENLDEELPASIAILFSAHEFLGPKGWCLTSGGELLHFILDTILDRLDTPIFEPFRDKIDIHLEQALFCLYLYPSKKNKISRHLVDHNVNPIPLSWERSFQLYQYYAPETLPEFNSYKSQSISADLEQLFKRIIGLMPNLNALNDRLPKLLDFIQGKSETLPEPLEFPGKVRAIYYLLGDYYFKEKEFSKCIKYYQYDICINPIRLDSWAALALSYAAQLENSLNYCEKLRNEAEFFDKAKSAQMCFRKALELDPENLVLWIECGSFEYLVHSFCSRLIKYESENFSMEKFELLESEKENYLDSSGHSLEQAIKLSEIDDSNEPDERWLQYYILGKIAEKKRKEPTEYLQHYIRASNLLNENNATYPEKISYNNPQHLSVEALELHYRIHASILKYLELHEGKVISHSLGTYFKKCLETTSKLYAQIQPAAVPSNVNNFEENAEEVVKACIEQLLNQVEEIIEGKEPPRLSEDDKKPELIVMETDDVIMIISDSDEEPPKLEKMVTTAPSSTTNVQAILDKMMEQTFLEKQDKSDCSEANNSGPDQVESGQQRKNNSSSSSSGSISSSESGSSDSETDDSDSSSISSSSSSDSANENHLSHTETLSLVDQCVQGLEICIKRLPQNYKALYRLAHLFFNYKSRKDYTKCKQLLLGNYKCKNEVFVNGLFADRSSKNFFNGIWRIPSTEIDRPGSLAAHMNRCVSLVLQVARNTNDTKTLIELCLQLNKVPDRDKIYIKDSDRTSFSDQALEMCVQSFKGQIKNVPTMNRPQVIKLLHDILKVYQRMEKNLSSKEGIFAALLTEAYKNFIKEPIGDNVNILELAIKFCQQHRPVDKHKMPVQNSSANFTARNAQLQQQPVLPTPSTLVPTPKPLKPPGVGRPRGRPPLPKIPGQIRQSRAKSPSSASYPWPSMYGTNFGYEYLKHYQEELIKQYSQNLSLNQLKQLTNYFASGQMSNPAMVGNQFLSQSSLFSNPATFLSTPVTSTGSFLDSSKTLPSMALGSFNSKQMQLKFLDSMLPKQQPKKVVSTLSSQVQPRVKTATVTSNNPKPKSGNDTPQKTALYIKERPNISITPVSSLSITPVSTAAKTTSLFPSNPLPSTYKPATSKSNYNAFFQPKSTHSLPPTSTSTSHFPAGSSGKTLQQKLAEKKKEQETKQMLTGGLIASIPASLSVSPSKPSSYLPVDKSGGGFGKFPTTSVSSVRSGQVKLPASLTVSQPVFQPRFPGESNPPISVTQVRNLKLFIDSVRFNVKTKRL